MESAINICDASSIIVIWNEGGLASSLLKDFLTPQMVPNKLTIIYKSILIWS